MSAVVREARFPASVRAVARALAGEPGLCVLAADPRGALRSADARASFVASGPVEMCDSWVPPSEPMGAASGWAGLPAAPRWVGVVPYEAGRGIERAGWTRAPDARPEPRLVRPRWLRFEACVRVDHATGRVAVEADHPRAADRVVALLASATTAAMRSAAARAGTFRLRVLADDEPGAAHEARVRAVLDLVACGDVYQVNLARRVVCTVEGDRLALFFALRQIAPSPYELFAELGLATVCASSPELALEVRDGVARTGPIKGTRPRGAYAGEDRAHAAALDADPKERAELTMAIDLHRNDLGRVAVPGSVRVLGGPRVLAGRTVWSRAAEVTARLRPDVDLEAVTRAMLPVGSVTGAPKVRAMEVIAGLEPHRRGLYTGAFGHVGRDGALVLAVAIRTLEIAPDGAGTYGTGGGIVADSDPARELEETRWKSAQLGALESWPEGALSSSDGVA